MESKKNNQPQKRRNSARILFPKRQRVVEPESLWSTLNYDCWVEIMLYLWSDNLKDVVSFAHTCKRWLEHYNKSEELRFGLYSQWPYRVLFLFLADLCCSKYFEGFNTHISVPENVSIQFAITKNREKFEYALFRCLSDTDRQLAKTLGIKQHEPFDLKSILPYTNFLFGNIFDLSWYDGLFCLERVLAIASDDEDNDSEDLTRNHVPNDHILFKFLGVYDNQPTLNLHSKIFIMRLQNKETRNTLWKQLAKYNNKLDLW
jgi:hypothetical protein